MPGLKKLGALQRIQIQQKYLSWLLKWKLIKVTVMKPGWTGTQLDRSNTQSWVHFGLNLIYEVKGLYHRLVTNLLSINQPLFHLSIHSFVHYSFFLSFSISISFSVRLFITHYSSFRRRICLPFKYSFFVTCCPVKFLIQSVVTSLKCSIVSSSVHPSFINHCLSITFLIDIQLASTPLWEAEESCGIYSTEMYLVESCNCICFIKSSEKPLLIRDFLWCVFGNKRAKREENEKE